MWPYLLGLNKRLVAVIPAALLTGFIAGLLLDEAVLSGLKGLVVPLTLLMVVPMMASLDPGHLRNGVSNLRLQLAAQAVNFCLIPFIAFALGRLLCQNQPGMALGLVLAALLPTSGMTVSWTGFARGNTAAAANMSIIGLVLGALAVPMYSPFLLDGASAPRPLSLLLQTGGIVFVPMLIGSLLRRALLARYPLNEFKQKIAPRFPATSTLGLLGIVFIAVAFRARGIADSPEVLLVILVLLLLFYPLIFLAGTLLGRMFFPRADAIALVYGTAIRNLTVALAVAMNSFGAAGADAALVIAVAYVIQVQAAAWYYKAADTLLGSAEPDRKPASG